MVKSPNRNYLLEFKGEDKSDCFIVEYRQESDLEDYCYYTMHHSQMLMECGLVKNNEYIPFKEFKNGEMTEYRYKMNNNMIDVSTKTTVFQGIYKDNPMEHYPGVIRDAFETLPTLPINAKQEIMDYIRKKEQEESIAKIATETDLSKVNKSTEILIFQESYLNEGQLQLQISNTQFPFLKKLILEKNCQNSKTVEFEKFEISGCNFLEEIVVNDNSFCWYMKYIIKGIIIVIIFS